MRRRGVRRAREPVRQRPRLQGALPALSPHPISPHLPGAERPGGLPLPAISSTHLTSRPHLPQASGDDLDRLRASLEQDSFFARHVEPYRRDMGYPLPARAENVLQRVASQIRGPNDGRCVMGYSRTEGWQCLG